MPTTMSRTVAGSNGKQAPSLPDYTIAQYARMSKDAILANIAQFPSNQGQQLLDNIIQYMNRQFMELSIMKESVCQPASGQGITQNFSETSPLLSFQVPTQNNGYINGFWVRYNLNIPLAAGTGATYAPNLSAPLSLFSSIEVNYGGTVHKFDGYIQKYLQQLLGQSMPAIPYQVLVGENDATVESYLYSGQPVVAGSTNTWSGAFFVPFNVLGDEDVRGLLPIQKGSTPCLINITCAKSIVGPEPTQNAIRVTGGTGGAEGAVTGTVSVYAQYRDGNSMTTNARLQPWLDKTPQLRLMKDVSLNNLVAGSLMYNNLSYNTLFPYVILTVVDGVQSSTYSQLSNLQIVGGYKSQAADSPFMAWGQGTNMSVLEYFTNYVRGSLMQDLDEGIIPLVLGPVYSQTNATNRKGRHYLNTSPQGGWPDFHYGVQVGAVGGVAGINPRVDCHVLMLASPLQVVAGS